MKKCAIIQSNFLPWKGYFDIINDVDIFIFLEDVQYTKRDWRNRNMIKVSNGTTQWINVPVHSEKIQNISNVKIRYDNDWNELIKTKINANYKKAPYFDSYVDTLFSYLDKKYVYLSSLNIDLIVAISDILGIHTKFINSVDLETNGTKDDKLLSLCKKVDADYYLSGPAAKNYIDVEKFKFAGVELAYKDYNYSKYPQQWGNFEHAVSIIDLLFNCGENAPRYIWGKK